MRCGVQGLGSRVAGLTSEGGLRVEGLTGEGGRPRAQRAREQCHFLYGLVHLLSMIDDK